MTHRASSWIRERLAARLLRRAVVSLVLAFALAASAAPGLTEYQVKAAFLFNFTRFTEWPAGTFTTTNAPLIIGIVGEDPFDKTLDDLVRGEVAQGHPLVIQRLRADEDLRHCHVLFISSSEKDRLPTLLAPLAGLPIETVGDVEGFAEKGGVVNFYLENKAVKMEINKAAADRAGLKISSKLFSLARGTKSK